MFSRNLFVVPPSPSFGPRVSSFGSSSGSLTRGTALLGIFSVCGRQGSRKKRTALKRSGRVPKPQASFTHN